MKMTYWRVMAISLSLAAPAAWADDQPPASTPGTEAKPTLEKTTRPATTTPRPSTPAVTADPVSGPGPAVVRQNNVNVRGKAAINSEVLTRLTRGQRVNVLEEVTLSKPKQDEPTKWAKISLPTNVTVWAHASFIDPANNAVKPNRLNLRSGPSENHSVIGRIEKGTVVTPIEHKGEWVKLEPPAAAYGFVAAHLLAKEAPALAATDPNAPPPIETAVAPTTTPAPATDPAAPPTTAAATPAAPAVTDPAATPPITVPETTPPPAPTPAEDPFVKRVVTREGIVERSVSIQAPSHFILQAIDTRRAINYLFSPATNVVLKDYYGQRILVTGEELLDERWPNTPVINVEKIETVP